MIATIIIHGADINRLQAYQYDKDSKYDVMYRILSDNIIDINKELFKEYSDEYFESYMYLEAMKREIEAKYIPLDIIDNISWNIDFRSGIMAFNIDNLNSNDINRLEDAGFVIKNS